MIIAFGLVGLIASWAVFILWSLDNSMTLGALGDFWRLAFTAPGISGLTWDLITSGLIASALAVHRRHVIGGGGLALVLGLTWALGLCAGLPALFALDAYRLHPRTAQ